MKVLLSYNENKNYLQYWPLVASAWQKFGFEPVMVLVSSKSSESLKWLRDFGTVYQIQPSPNVDPGIFAKIARFQLYIKFNNQIVMVSDGDMLPLQAAYFLRFPDSFDPSCQLLCKGGDHFSTSDPKAKFPGCYMITSSANWKRILQLDESTNFDSWIQNLFTIDGIDGKEALNNPYSNFSEESLIRYLAVNWSPTGVNILREPRPGGWNWSLNSEGLRLDRSCWPTDICFKQMGFRTGVKFPSKLTKGGKRTQLIDAHLPRPLEKHINDILPLIEYIGISRSILEYSLMKTKSFF